MDVRLALIGLLKRALTGGEITNDELFAAAPNPTALNQLERLAWQRLSHWADDDDIRAKNKTYAEMQTRQIADALADLEALEAGYIPSEIIWGEHRATLIHPFGCLALAIVLAVLLYAMFAQGFFMHGDR